jgi:hypothetical protein
MKWNWCLVILIKSDVPLSSCLADELGEERYKASEVQRPQKGNI